MLLLDLWNAGEIFLFIWGKWGLGVMTGIEGAEMPASRQGSRQKTRIDSTQFLIYVTFSMPSKSTQRLDEHYLHSRVQLLIETMQPMHIPLRLRAYSP